MRGDGLEITNITFHPGIDGEPDWSPDGSRIVFTSDREGNEDIYIVNADGTGVMQLTDHPAPDTEPQWSPDGTRIAFTSARDPRAEVYVIDPDGTGLTRLTDGPDDNDGLAKLFQPLRF